MNSIDFYEQALVAILENRHQNFDFVPKELRNNEKIIEARKAGIVKDIKKQFESGEQKVVFFIPAEYYYSDFVLNAIKEIHTKELEKNPDFWKALKRHKKYTDDPDYINARRNGIINSINTNRILPTIPQELLNDPEIKEIIKQKEINNLKENPYYWQSLTKKEKQNTEYIEAARQGVISLIKKDYNFYKSFKKDSELFFKDADFKDDPEFFEEYKNGLLEEAKNL